MTTTTSTTTNGNNYSKKQRNFVPNTYIVQCRNMIMADIWADLGAYGLQFLKTIHLGPNSSHYNYLAVFEKNFLSKKNQGIVPLPKDAIVRVATPGRAWSDAVANGGRGRGRGRGSADGQKSQRPSPPPPPPPTVEPSVSPLVVEDDNVVIEEDALPPSTNPASEIVLKGCVSGETFSLRPFFVSPDFNFKTHAGVSIVPHIIVMYPRTPQYSQDQYKSWLEKAIQALVTAGVLPPDSCRIITDVLDKNHLRRVETNNAFIQFKSGVSHEARNAVYAILRHALWFFSLSTDNFDPVLIQSVDTPSRVMCQWKIARGGAATAGTSS